MPIQRRETATRAGRVASLRQFMKKKKKKKGKFSESFPPQTSAQRAVAINELAFS